MITLKICAFVLKLEEALPNQIATHDGQRPSDHYGLLYTYTAYCRSYRMGCLKRMTKYFRNGLRKLLLI